MGTAIETGKKNKLADFRRRFSPEDVLSALRLNPMVATMPSK